MARQLIFIALIIFSNLFVSLQAAVDTRVARVISVSEIKQEPIREQVVKMKFKDDGEEIFLSNLVPDNKAYAIVAEEGKDYLVNIEEGNELFITDYYREPAVIFLISLFLFLIILFGAFRGVKAILSLAITGASIIYILIPGIKSGLDPILLTILISAVATASTMILIAGFTKKSLAATIGTTGGVTAAGIIAMITVKLAPLSGLASTEAHILLANLQGVKLNFQGILASGIIIASLGAAMDVAISIASATQEIYEANPNQARRELFAHAVNIGRDIMGTMTNTLILAYTGTSIPLFLLLINESGLRLLNMEIIATELSSALIGSIGLLLAIPITAMSSVIFLKGLKKKKPKILELAEVV